MSPYKVKLGVQVLYEIEIDVEAEDAIGAMDKAIEGYNNNLIPPVKAVKTTEPAIISVNKK